MSWHWENHLAPLPFCHGASMSCKDLSPPDICCFIGINPDAQGMTGIPKPKAMGEIFGLLFKPVTSPIGKPIDSHLDKKSVLETNRSWDFRYRFLTSWAAQDFPFSSCFAGLHGLRSRHTPGAHAALGFRRWQFRALRVGHGDMCRPCGSNESRVVLSYDHPISVFIDN